MKRQRRRGRLVEHPFAIRADAGAQKVILSLRPADDELSRVLVHGQLEKPPLSTPMGLEDHRFAIGGPCCRYVPTLVQREASWVLDLRLVDLEISHIHTRLARPFFE